MSMFQSQNVDNQPQQSQNVEQKSRVKSVLRYTMMPEILPRIRAIGFHFGHFAYLLALVFASARLIPSTHPVLNAVNIGKYTVRQVIALAANNITWSWKNVDQVAIFSAIIIGLIMIVIQAVLIATAALLGADPASAAAPTSFFSPGGSYVAADDPMMVFFAQVFGDLNGFWGFASGDLNSDGVIAAPGSSTMIHDGIYAMLSLYSMAMMVIAVIIVLYYIMTVVGEAAKTGTPFGNRFNSLWAPIRLVIALGLLVPLGSGLNSAQYMTLWIAKMGSGLGTQVWLQMVGQFDAGDSENYIVGDFKNEWVKIAAKNVFMMEVCRFAEAKYNDVATIGDNSLAPKVVLENDDTYAYTVNYEKGGNWFGDGSHVKCGEISLNLRDETPTDSIVLTSLSLPVDKAFDLSKQIIDRLTGIDGSPSRIAEIAESLVATEITIGGTEPGQVFEPMMEELFELAEGIRDSVFANASADTENIRTGVDNFMSEFVDKRKASWVYAGVWYLEIGRIIQNSKDIKSNSIPNFNVVDINNINDDVVISRETLVLMSKLNTYFNSRLSELTGINENPDVPDACKGLNDEAGIIEKFACFAISMMVPKSLVLLAQPETREMNPMASLINSGYEIFNRSFIALGLGFVMQATSEALKDSVLTKYISKIPIVGSAVGSIFNIALSFMGHLGGLLTSIAFVGLGVGMILAFLLPILPFMYFFFAIVSWVMEIFEAVIAMPLWALAHLSIDGDGMPGQAAMSGYYLLLAILLRPALIVIGLIAGSVVFGGAIYLLQSLFYQVLIVKGSGSSSGVEVIIYSVIFAYITYMAGITSFKLVDSIPNQILRWIGSGASTFADGNDVDLGGNQQMMLAGGAIAGNMIGGGVSSVAKGSGETLNSMIKGRQGGSDGGGSDKPKDTSPLRDPRDSK